MSQAISTIQAANNGISGILSLITQAKSLAQSALRTSDTTAINSYASQYDAILEQITDLSGDSGYSGANLLAAQDLTVVFGWASDDSLQVQGFDATSSGLGLTTAISAGTTTSSTDNNPAPTSSRDFTGFPITGGPYTAGQSFQNPLFALYLGEADFVRATPTNYRLVDHATGAIAIITGATGCTPEGTVISGTINTGNILTLEYYSEGVNQTTGAPDPVTTTTTTPDGNAWFTASGIQSSITEIDNAMTTLRTQTATLSGNLGVVTTRQNFTDSMINTLITGAEKLTLTDMNLEGVNMLMLQTRQSLGSTALSLSSQAAQSVLMLF